MKFSLSLLFFGFLVLAFSGCDDDDEAFNPVQELGRFDGWALESIESNYAAQVDATLAGVSDADIEMTGQTRAELRASYDSDVARATEIKECDRDNALFFTSGITAVGRGTTPCPGSGDPTVLDPLSGYQYSSDLMVTELTLTSLDGMTQIVYDVPEISSSVLRLSQQRTVSGNVLVPTFTYNITYNFRAR